MRSLLTHFGVALLMLTACSTTSTPDATMVAQAVNTELAIQAATQTQASYDMATHVAATLTAQPTNTSTHTPVPTSTATPTPTASPTASASPTLRPTSTSTTAPTKVSVAVTQAPPTSAPPPTSSGGSIYSTASGGPQGYTSTFACFQVSGTACESVMSPGDISFSITLRSAEDALLAIFVPFGLSVEKDGANAADMYMTVDAGWLPPGSAARFGTSRTFSQPGRYTIRTNGCLITEASYPNCTWWTVNGTIATFDIR